MKHVLLALLALVPYSTAASAQFSGVDYYAILDPGNAGNAFAKNTGTPVDAGTTYVSVHKIGACVPVPEYGPPGCYTAPLFVPLSSFAGPGMAAQTQLNAIQAQLNAAQTQLNSFSSQLSTLNAELSRTTELTAVAAALKDAIPNPGDRFALRLNAAGFSGQVAGAIGVSYNVTDRARLSVNYGQGRTQSIVSGGMNVSFR